MFEYDSNIHSLITRRMPISLYRYEIRDGVRIRVKRSLIRLWNWTFNRSEEDYLTRLKNEYTLGMEKLKRLRRIIPKVEKEFKEAREDLANKGGVTIPHRDRWTRRREPARLIEETTLAKKKKDRGHPKPAVLFEATVPKR